MPQIDEVDDVRDDRTPNDGDEDDEELLKEIRENFDSDKDYWDPIRAEGDIDMRYLSGDAWDPRERNSRTAGAPNEQRLCLSFDELNQNVNQVVNNFRQNKPSIKVEPKGYGAMDKTAEMRENMIRQIEYRSNALMAYTVAFENQVKRGYGFYQICCDFESPKSFNQEIYIEPISNPNSVLPDPNGTKVDGSDWKRCFKLREYTHGEFRRNWPEAEVRSFGPDLMKLYPDWFGEKTVQVVEYWKVKEQRKTLLALDQEVQDASGKVSASLVLEDSPDYSVKQKVLYLGKRPVAMVLTSRPTITKSVWQYIANGVEILERNPQLGEYIPIIPMYGQEMWVTDGGMTKRKLLSLIRLARDPQAAYAYLRTTQMELIGQIPKAPFIGAKGQFSGYEDSWANVNRVRMAFLEYDPMPDSVPSGTVLPPPTQVHFEPAVQTLELVAEAQRRAIQSAMGIAPLPTQALRRNEKSGVALQQIEESQSIGSYHFMDNAKMSMAHGGRVINSWLSGVYDTPRDVGIRKADETFGLTKTFQQIQDERTMEMVERNMLEIGEHEVTISTGPNYQSQRQEASQFADLLASSNPEVFTLLGPLIVRLKQLGPIGDQMAELLTYAQPPEVRAAEAAKAEGQEPIPPAAQAKMQEQQQALAVAQALIQELQVKANEQQTKIQVAEIQKGTDFEKAQLEKSAELQRVQIELAAESERLDKQLATQLQIAEMNNRTTLIAKEMDVQAKANLAVLGHEVKRAEKTMDAEMDRANMDAENEWKMEAQELAHEQGMEAKGADLDADIVKSYIDHEQGEVDAAKAHERALEMKDKEKELKPKGE